MGLGGGIFAHGTLTLTMSRLRQAQVGLALGAWGAVQATSAGAQWLWAASGATVMGALAAQGYSRHWLLTSGYRWLLSTSSRSLLLQATCAGHAPLFG
jgi:BCD family chlorophyll transporter-like MFS transporter